jgi:adenylate cyclase
MLFRFTVNATATLMIILAIVLLAVREAGRAEAVAELEYERSEALLTNVLPAAIAKRLKSQTGQVIADR